MQKMCACVCVPARSQQQFSFSPQVRLKLLEENDRLRCSNRSSNNSQGELFFVFMNSDSFHTDGQIAALRTAAYGFPAAIAISNTFAA